MEAPGGWLHGDAGLRSTELEAYGFAGRRALLEPRLRCGALGWKAWCPGLSGILAEGRVQSSGLWGRGFGLQNLGFEVQGSWPESVSDVFFGFEAWGSQGWIGGVCVLAVYVEGRERTVLLWKAGAM